jgi:UDP-glucose 4-epimerase
MQRVVVTGCAGFIGSVLSKKLVDSGFRVIGIDNMLYGYEDNLIWASNKPTFIFHKLDILSESFIELVEKGDIVIHCAGIAPLPINQEYPMKSIHINVAGTANVLEACRIKGAKHVLFASTSAVYENTTTFPSKESDSLHPTLLYSLGKKWCEELCESFSVNYKLPFTILRFFNVYGPHHDCLRKNPPLIAYIQQSFLKGVQPLLHSTGKQKRDYIYIDDLLDLILRILNNLDKADKKTYNICSGETTSVEEIVQYIQQCMNVNIQPIYREPALLWQNNTQLWRGDYTILPTAVEKEVNKYSEGDFTQAALDFGWKPSVSFQDGLTKTLHHSRELMNNI